MPFCDESSFALPLFPVRRRRTREGGSPIVLVHPRDTRDRDLLRAHRLAGAEIRAGAKRLLLHRLDHLPGALRSFGLPLRKQTEVRDLGADEEHRGAVRARCDTGAAADALGEVHRVLEGLGRDRDRVGVRSAAGANGNKTAGIHDAIEGRAIDHQIANDREGLGAPGLDRDLIPVVEMAHVKLANGAALLVAVGNSVDHKAAGSADALTTVVLECDRVLTLVDQILIEHIQHFED